MIKCPNCGSTAQVMPLFTKTTGDDVLIVKRIYGCGCGTTIKTVQYYMAEDKEVIYETKNN